MSLTEISKKNVVLFFLGLIGIVYFYYYLTSRAPIVKVINERVYKNGTSLRVMTFNIWYGGSKVENGIQKIAKHIKFIDPDVVAIQVTFSTKIFSRRVRKRPSSQSWPLCPSVEWTPKSSHNGDPLGPCPLP
jgi:hypothetical protein